MDWTVETFDVAVDDEIRRLPPGLRSNLIRLMETIENVGLEKLREPQVKHLTGKLWELRIRGAEGIARGIYITVTGRKIIILHVFVKKTQKIPTKAFALAHERMKKVVL